MGRRKNRDRQSTFEVDTTYEDMVAELRRTIEDKDATILNYEKQLKEKELEILRRETIPPQQNQINPVIQSLGFKDIESALPRFSGQDSYPVSRWISEFENLSEIYQLSDLQKLAYGRRMLEGTAQIAVASISSPKTWNEFKQFLLNEFKRSENVADIHLKLAERKKKPDETFLEYLFAIRQLGHVINLEDDAIIKYVIRGIKDSEFNKAILYGARNLHEFKERLRSYEDICEKQNAVNVSTRIRSRGSGSQSDQIIRSPRCYNCGSRGHLAKDCRKKAAGVKCFECNKFGHKSSDCRSKAKRAEGQTTASLGLTREVIDSKLNTNKDILINDKPVLACIDTGSDISLVSEETYNTLNIEELANRIVFQGVGSTEIRSLGSFEAKVEIDGNIFQERFHVSPKHVLPKSCIIGKTLLSKAIVIMQPSGIQIKPVNPVILGTCLQILSGEDDLSHIKNPTIRNDLRTMVESYIPKKIKMPPIEMKILLRNESPIWQSPRGLPLAESKIVDAQIDEWLNNGIIQESSSDFASPIVVVNKKDGSKRICIDFRALNKVVIQDRYPIPSIDSHIDKLYNAKVFTTLDLKNGFFHVPVSEDSRKYTGFVTPSGHYEFLKVPFGLCSSPAVFQRFVNKVFEPLIKQNKVLVYIDDLVIPAESEEENLKRLKEVLKIAEEYGLEIKWTKCQFLKREITYLGYEIGGGTLRPSKEKTIAVQRFPEPKNIKQLQAFLGLTGFFRRFIPDYSKIAKPLSDLLKKDRKFQFEDTQRHSFNTLKTLLCQKPVLTIFDPDAYTELHTDASKYGYGACLLQRCKDDSKLHPIHFYSRKTSPAEQNYSSYELEALAIVKALKKFRVYLIDIEFQIVTDCSAFKNTMNKKDIEPRIARWALALEDYNYQIEHRSGTSMKHVDALSRNPYTLIIGTPVLAQVEAAQKKDLAAHAIMEVLKTNEFDDFVLDNNILFKIKDDKNLLYIPKGMQMEIIRKVHEQGHFESRKMMEIIERDYYIPKLKDKLISHVQNCVRCILASKKEKKEGYLHPIPKEPLPLHTYHLDHLGPMTITNKRYKYIFTVVDAFTKFIWLYPTKDTTAAEVIKKLQIQQAVFGNPVRCITDRGTAFTSTAFKEYCATEGIDLVHITTGVPRGNGQVERVHRTVISALTKLSIGKANEWYKYTDRLQRFLNNSLVRSTNTTPFRLLFGTDMRNKEDDKLAEIVREEIIETFNEERDKTRETAAKQIFKIQEENKKTYNCKRKPATAYQKNDLVAIKRTQFGPGLKISPKYLGPYKVTNVKPNDRYDVEKVGHHEGPFTTSTSADQMKRFVTFDSEDEEDERDENSED